MNLPNERIQSISCNVRYIVVTMSVPPPTVTSKWRGKDTFSQVTKGIFLKFLK